MTKPPLDPPPPDLDEHLDECDVATDLIDGDLEECFIQAVNLSSRDAKGLRLAGCRCAGVNLSGATLTPASFRDVEWPVTWRGRGDCN